MKKVLILVFLCMLCVPALLAEVHYEYASWNDIRAKWANDSQTGELFRKNDERLNVWYEATELKVVPFLEAIGNDAEIWVSFDRAPEDDYGVPLATWVSYASDDMIIDFVNPSVDFGGLHGHAYVYDGDPTLLSYDHFLLKQDGSFVRGTGSNEPEDPFLSFDFHGHMMPLLFPSFDYYLEEYGVLEGFLEQEDVIRAKYDGIVREVLPFFAPMYFDAGIEFFFFFSIDEDGNRTYEPFLVYDKPGLNLEMANMHVEEDGLHAYAILYNVSWRVLMEADTLLELAFDDFILKQDGSFVSGLANDDSSHNCFNSDSKGYFFELFDSRLEDTPEGRIIISDEFWLYTHNVYSSETGDPVYLMAGSATFDWEGNLLAHEPCYESQDLEIEDITCTLDRVEWNGDELICEGEFSINGTAFSGRSSNIHISINEFEEHVSIDAPELTYEFTLDGSRYRGKGFRTYLKQYGEQSVRRIACTDVEQIDGEEIYPVGSIVMQLADGTLRLISAS